MLVFVIRTCNGQYIHTPWQLLNIQLTILINKITVINHLARNVRDFHHQLRNGEHVTSLKMEHISIYNSRINESYERFIIPDWIRYSGILIWPEVRSSNIGIVQAVAVCSYQESIVLRSVIHGTYNRKIQYIPTFPDPCGSAGSKIQRAVQSNGSSNIIFSNRIIRRVFPYHDH